MDTNEMRKGADGKGVVPLSFLSHPSWGLANGGLALGLDPAPHQHSSHTNYMASWCPVLY